jgi:transcription elongation GreA/GreB family factor
MSQAFVKNDADIPEEPVERQPSGRPNYVTSAGRAMLEARVKELIALRAGLIKAKRPGEAAGLPLRQAEIDLRYYETQLKRAILVDHRGLAAADARFGSTVRIRESGGAEKEFLIVGEDEADPAAGRINWASPLAAALLGAKAGSLVTFTRKNEEVELEVLSVTYQKEPQV